MDIDNWKRRIVLVATDVQVSGLEHDKEGLELLKKEQVTILPVKQEKEFEEKFTLLGEMRLDPGQLLIMSPYDENSYVDISNARSLIAVEKAALTIRFCSLLGAKSISFLNVKIVDKEKHKELTIDASSNKISGELIAKMEEIENIKNQIEIIAKSTGGKPNFEKAEKLLKRTRLISDPLLKHLLEMVRDSVDTDNKLNEITQKICLTQALQKSFDLVASINFPSGFVTGSFSSTVKEKIEIYLSLGIKF